MSGEKNPAERTRNNMTNLDTTLISINRGLYCSGVLYSKTPRYCCWSSSGVRILIISSLISLFGLFSSPAFGAEAVDVQALANAIYRAEGGARTAHPYGILKKYKTTTPRQACINTIKSNLKRWEASGSKGSFIEFLGAVYAPVGASNDPTGSNRNWIRNVTAIYNANRGKS